MFRRVVQEENGLRDGIVTCARMWCSNHYRAIALAAACQWTKAATEFEKAIAVYRTAGFDAPFAWSVVHLGETAVRCGRRPMLRRASTLIAEALPLAKKLGMIAASDRMETVAREIGPRGRQVMGLTERELEVLELLARGQSNPRIADELTISANTVATHVKNIYSKLAVTNRAEVVRAALRLGIGPGTVESD